MFDNETILRGLYGGVLVDLDEDDVAATSKTVNDDGNVVVEINGTPTKGLAAVMILTEAADSNAYDDEAVITIEVSDYIDRNWETVTTFPTLHCHLKQVEITATTAFVAADVGDTATEETSGDTGVILWYDPALETVGGTGKVLIEMDAADDLFDAAIGKTITSGGTGAGTKTTALLPDPTQMQPAVYVRNFTTEKKYVRCNCSNVEDNFGKVWIFLTANAFQRI